MSTQAINIPVGTFFALPDPTKNMEFLSKRTFALFIDRANRMIGLLWLILLLQVASSQNKSAESLPICEEMPGIAKHL